jgi:hypothetical protein
MNVKMIYYEQINKEKKEDENDKYDIEEVMCRQTELTVSSWTRELTDEEKSELYRLDKILQKYDEAKIREIELQKKMKKLERLRNKNN